MNSLARKIREGDARALARASTGIENRDPQALETLRELKEFAGQARIIGITGPPGAGKSTLVDALATALRIQGKTVAILAIDPTSRITTPIRVSSFVPWRRADRWVAWRAPPPIWCGSWIAPARILSLSKRSAWDRTKSKSPASRK
jgi:energy-coupling factor transporter ATP-binding protein EcfA2